MTGHAAVDVNGNPYAVPGFGYEAHDRWAEMGFCPVVSVSRAWCGKQPGHGGMHGSPVKAPPGGREVNWAEWGPVTGGPVTLCANCGLPVRQVARRDASAAAALTRRGRTTITGWDHFGFWQGARCPGMACGARPGRVLSREEYLAWADEKLAVRE